MLTTDTKILIIEDDSAQSTLFQRWLEQRGYMVQVCESAEAGFFKLSSEAFDVVLVDVELPGMSGLEFTHYIRNGQHDCAVILMTAHQKFEYVKAGFDLGVHDFLTKPAKKDDLLSKVQRVLESRKKQQGDRQVVLAIGAHPDDVEIGVGGTLLEHKKRGDEIYILTMCGGSAGGAESTRRLESQRAASFLGAQLVVESCQDTQISAGPETISLIEKHVREIQPDIVYTHTISDNHQDHRSVHQATIIACRKVPSIMTYQSPSSTIAFQPTCFMNIDTHLRDKLEAISLYESQTSKCDYLDPDLIRSTARYWARYAGAKFVEPLEIIRSSMRLNKDDTATQQNIAEIKSIA